MSNKKQIDIKRLNDILQSTIDGIKNSKNEIEEIVIYSKREHERLEKELEGLKQEITDQIDEVRRVEKLNKKHRQNLLEKSKNFDDYSEEEKKESYDLANQTRVILLLKREEEKSLIKRRTELEMRLKSSFELYKKAKDLGKQINVATEYLLGNIDNITSTVDELSEKYILGIKIIEAQEEERLRLALDIHDGPAQSLANIILKAELCEKLIEKDKGRAKEEIIQLKNLTRQTLNSVRNVIYELRPMSLDDLGLIPTLEKYIDKFKSENNIYINLTVIQNQENLDPALGVSLFRMVQESLNNIKKHSKAKEAKIIIEKTIKQINLSINDDGIGFDVDKHFGNYNNISNGFGLMSIKQRVELLGGKFKITSSENKGTRLSINIPMGSEIDARK